MLNLTVDQLAHQRDLILARLLEFERRYVGLQVTVQLPQSAPAVVDLAPQHRQARVLAAELPRHFVNDDFRRAQPAARASTSRSVTSGYSSVISATPGVLER